MAYVLMNIKWEGAPPSLDALMERYGLDPDDLDGEFGVVEIDPDDQLYAIRVDRDAAEKLSDEFGGSDDVEGPFSDPPIAPFDLPE